MNKIRIFLDLDGVITNFNKKLCSLLNIDEEDSFNRNILKSNFNGIKKLSRYSLIDKIIRENKSDFWENLELLPWAMDLYNSLSNKFSVDNIYFLTSCGDWEDGSTGKIRFIRKHFNSTRYVITAKKYTCATKNSFLIDDKPKNVELFNNEGGNSYLFPNQYKILDNEIKFETVMSEIIAGINKIQ